MFSIDDNYYTFLGLPPFTTDQNQISSAFQERMVMVSRMNLREGDKKIVSNELVRVYNILSNPSSKAEYDNLLIRKIVTNSNGNSGYSSSSSKKSTSSRHSSIGWNDFKPLVYIFILCVVVAIIITFTISGNSKGDTAYKPSTYKPSTSTAYNTKDYLSNNNYNDYYDDEGNDQLSQMQGIYSSSSTQTTQNKSSSISNSTSKPTTSSKVITPKEPEFDESTIINYINGDMPYSSYYGPGIYNRRSLSELTLINYSSSDAVAIVEAVGGGVIRHAYIAEGRSYTMKQMPECICTVKIMFGKRWSSEKDNGSGYPRGGFTKSTSYSEADTSFDFYSEEDYDGINYPTYSLTLHTVVGGNTRTSKIGKDDFFN